MKIVNVRKDGMFKSVQDLVHRCGVDRKNLSSLTEANALLKVSKHRHRAYWDAAGVELPTEVLGFPVFNEVEPMLPISDDWDETLSDYGSTGLTLGFFIDDVLL